MDDAILERLMIDDALQALAPDVSALLAAYTAGMPAAGERRARWRDLADAARAALEVEASEELPPFPANKLRTSQRWHKARIGLSVAAVLALGVGIGSWWPTKPAAAPTVGRIASPLQSEPPRSTGIQDFWSSQRLLASAAQHRVGNHPALKWTSPLTESPNGELQ